MRVFVILALLAGTARADEEIIAPEPEPPRKTPFDRGRMNLSVAGGSSSAFGQRYFGLGAGFGYFVLDGLELGISGLHQWGDGPSISKVAPSVRYIAQPLVGHSPLIPYVGVFYNHWFIGESYPDIDAIGSRAGLLYISGRILLGLGIAVERTVSECPLDDNGERECWTYYPDITISLSF